MSYKEFFKVIQNHELHNGELRIPEIYVQKQYWKGISNPVTLLLPNGIEQNIFWVERNGDIWLKKNWEKIAKFMKFGYVLFFKYIGGSCFKVRIHGLKNTLEINYDNIKLMDEKEDQVGHDEKPSFIVQMTHSYIVNANLVRIPMVFSKKYLKNFQGDVKIKVGDDIAMKVKVTWNEFNGHRTSVITTGWKKFIHKYNVKVGDYCKFVMIQKQPPFFNVFIEEESPEMEDFEDHELELKTLKIGVNASYPYVYNEYFRRHRELNGRFMEIQKGGKKSWLVKVKYYDKDIKLYAGWPKFKEECGLKVGDVCHFELIDEDNFLFNLVSVEKNH